MNHLHYPTPRLLLLDKSEQDRRLERLRSSMLAHNIEWGFVTGNANKYYLTGRVFLGYILIGKATVTYYVKRPVELIGDDVVYIRKPEDIHWNAGNVALELNSLSYSEACRLAAVFGMKDIPDFSDSLSAARSVKTAYEIELLQESGRCQDDVYRNIPGLFKPGMSDIEFQIEIEHLSRMAGCLGQFRISGDTMELFMGNVLAGDNADAPSPYDFAMGGAGLNPSIPVGANGTVIEEGMSVMVDINGNYTGYMTDMTRVYKVGSISQKAIDAQQCSIEIHRMIQREAIPGTPARQLYEHTVEIVRQRGLEQYFMGHRQHAGFVGHGVGIEINEQPVIAPRSKSIIEDGNVIAIEPKFVIPGTGAVGIENTYVVRNNGMECITNCNEDIIDLL